jgi:hypothetical protein
LIVVGASVIFEAIDRFVGSRERRHLGQDGQDRPSGRWGPGRRSTPSRQTDPSDGVFVGAERANSQAEPGSVRSLLSGYRMLNVSGLLHEMRLSRGTCSSLPVGDHIMRPILADALWSILHVMPLLTYNCRLREYSRRALSAIARFVPAWHRGAHARWRVGIDSVSGASFRAVFTPLE